MKKKLLLFTLAAGFGTMILSSYSEGPAHGDGIPGNNFDCTGAESAGVGAFANSTGCSVGSGCHATSVTTGISVAIELDSAGVATTHYRPGVTYSVKITGTNTTGTTFPKYGFQIAALKGTTSTTSNVDAGTWATTGLPASTRITAPTSGTQLTIAEHSASINLSGTTFTQSFSWTAPTTNIGSISLWSAANFVNGDGNATAADKWNTAHQQIDIWPSAAGVGDMADNISITAYPNPTTTTLNLQLANAATGTYSLQVFNLNGSTIATQNIEVSSGQQATSINTSNWTPGVYNVVVAKDDCRKTILVVKQ